MKKREPSVGPRRRINVMVREPIADHVQTEARRRNVTQSVVVNEMLAKAMNSPGVELGQKTGE